MSNAGDGATSRRSTWGLVACVILGLIAGVWYFVLREGTTPGSELLDSVVLNSDPSTTVQEDPVTNSPVSQDPSATASPEPQNEQVIAPDPQPETIDPAETQTATDLTDDATPEETLPAAVEQADSASTSEQIPPSFDEIRQEADGLTVIAGRAAPGSTVTVLVDGVAVATAVADWRGSFAALGFLELGAAGSVVTLRQGQGTDSIASAEEIILVPQQKPTAEPEPVNTEIALAETTSELQAEPEPSVAAAPAPTPSVRTPEPSVEVDPQDTASVASEPDGATSESAGTLSEPASPASEPVVTTAEPVQTTSVQATKPEGTAEPAPASTVETAAAPAPNARVEVTELEGQAPPVAAPAAPNPEPVVRTQTPVAVLRSTQSGVELLQAPPAVGTVALDTIGYSDEGEVQLAGRARAGAVEVRIYLDNDLRAQLAVAPDGRWRGELRDVAPGIYTLRADEVDATGAVTSRVETPFKREAPAVLAEASSGQDGPVRAITVQRGDTLWAIARDRYGEGMLFVRVFEANKADIRDPDLIYPGQVFDLPD